jgi:pimeloyl-ACP methyl ester carboxylesterase
LNKLSVKQCYMVGNSLGGEITWNYAAAHPQKVKKMILLDAAGFRFDTKKSGTLAFKIGRNPYLKNTLLFFTPRLGVEKSVKDAYFDDTKVTPELVQRYMDCTRREGNRNALIVRLNQPFIDNTEALKQLNIPTLIVWGDNDDVVPVECAYKFQAYLPNNKLIILKDEGHVVMEENPEKIIPIIKEWFN